MRCLSKPRFSSCKGVWLVAILLTATLNGVLTQVVRAQTTITVNTIDDVVADDGQCSLREAITAANIDTASGAAAGECLAGSGEDTIQFDPALVSGGPQTIDLTLFDTGLDSDEFGPTAFDVTSDITIIGPTASGITLARSGSSNFRLFRVTSSGNLTIRDLTLTNGVAAGGRGWDVFDGGAGGGGGAGMGGAIFNEGSLTLENTTLRNHQAIGGSGGFGGDGGAGNGGGGVSQNGVSGNDLINPGQGGGPNGGTGNIDTPTDGGNGGGGGGSGSFSANGGNGGFGGGGGGASGDGNSGGNGGFGGGGGGNRAVSGTTGLGGFGGGNSDRSAAGGGAGMGGAIFNRGGTVAIINSTLSQNSAQGGSAFGGVAGTGHGLGGAIFNLDGTVTLQFSTLSHNDVTTGFGNAPRVDGGAIFNKQLNGAAILTLDNTILANTANDQTDLYNDGGSITGSQSNIVETNAAGVNGAADGLLIANNGNPKLGTLADNGGPTYTHALLTGSPALDVTANGSYGCGTTIATDQRGIVRPQDTSCDIGAFELAHFTLTVALAGMGSGTLSLDPPGGTYASGTVVTATATADTGSIFTGWSGGCTGLDLCILTMDGDKSVTATFALNTYTITPTAGAGGTITPSTPQMVDHGGSLAFTITPNAGYYIVEVRVDGVSQGAVDSYTFDSVTSDHTINATFASDVQPASGLAVSKRVSVAEAIVGETAITYSYQVTNTGEVSLTGEALDDKLGVIAWTLQAGGTAAPTVALVPGQVAVGTHTYTPQMSDLPGPLVNTIVVTGTVSDGMMPVTATASVEVGLLVRSQARTMCYGVDIDALIAVQPAAMDTGPVDLVVISGPAPQGLLLRSVTACVPYTGLRSMVELTNSLVTADCLGQTTPCNPVRRLLFGYRGDYTITTIQEVQTVTDFFLPLVWHACRDEPFCR